MYTDEPRTGLRGRRLAAAGSAAAAVLCAAAGAAPAAAQPVPAPDANEPAECSAAACAHGYGYAIERDGGEWEFVVVWTGTGDRPAEPETVSVLTPGSGYTTKPMSEVRADLARARVVDLGMHEIPGGPQKVQPQPAPDPPVQSVPGEQPGRANVAPHTEHQQATPPGPAGSDAPPPEFWGDPASIPAPQNVVTVAVQNHTNGQYPDDQVYWSFDGQTHSIAEQPYLDMAANSAGRMYFFLGAPDSPYYDFIEFTVEPARLNVNTSRVDRFGLKLAVKAQGRDGSEQVIGENHGTFTESREATFERFGAGVPDEFTGLATVQAPYGIPAPGTDPSFQPGGPYATYLVDYAAANGVTVASAAEIFTCSGALAGNPQLCAALNRHVADLPAQAQGDPANFYQAAPANFYARFWHTAAIGGKQYGFPYDDAGDQSSFIALDNPQSMIVAVGW